MTSFKLFDQRLEYLRELHKDFRDDSDTMQELGGGTKISLLDTKGVVSDSNISRCIAPVDVLLHVLRGFEDKDLTHLEEILDPLSNYRTVNREMKAQVFKKNFCLNIDLMKYIFCVSISFF